MSERTIDGAEVEREVLAALKPFQRTTVEHVFHQMYRNPKPSTRFLVADEVGLGKTLVARGVIAKAINHLQRQGIDRIDVLYICSNAEIAAQNIRRLNVIGDVTLNQATRITLLPKVFHQVSGREINFVSLTPGTSFNMASSKGMGEERAVLYRLLQYARKRTFPHVGAYRVLKGDMKLENFQALVQSTPEVGSPPKPHLDRGLADAFCSQLNRRPELLQRFRDLTDKRGVRSSDCTAVIRDLRLTLAQSCVQALEPDLVIMDEFQRFRELLDAPNPEDPDDIRQLAQHLFAYDNVRVLLLSATPYKMYTLRDEGLTDDHYSDFLKTVRFLTNNSSTEIDALAADLRSFRSGLMRIPTDGIEPVVASKAQIETRLKRVIVRTERPARTQTGEDVLSQAIKPDTPLSASDIRSYCMADRVSRLINNENITEYWKSAPYLLNIMGDYQLKKKVRDLASDPQQTTELRNCIDPTVMLNFGRIGDYEEIDPGNARLRALAQDTIDRGAWRLLWLPPSLPYYQGGGAYVVPSLAGMTKRLVFSSWTVVPEAIALLLSYDAERFMMRSRNVKVRNTAEERARGRGLLAVRTLDGVAQNMTLFALLYPAPQLGRLADPLAIARTLRSESNQTITSESVLERAEQLIATAIEPIIARYRSKAGAADQRWYWAAPLLLDQTISPGSSALTEWLQDPGSIGAVTKLDDDGERADSAGWTSMIEVVREIVETEGNALGPPPEDIAFWLARIAIGGPGVCAYRALGTVLYLSEGTDEAGELAKLRAALRIAAGFRSLYNVPEVMALLRPEIGEESDDHYWQLCLMEGICGNLQAVLDEYVSLLPDALGVAQTDDGTIAFHVGEAITEVLMLRAANSTVDDFMLSDGQVTIEPKRMRTRFALAFGGRSRDEAGNLQRLKAVRSSFNSPFWPFVLASTSVGQEGLDFHQYCHAIVHWNLPANPVDFEQREGRVNRYMGHAIRKNIATRHANAVFRSDARQPWKAMFSEAEAECQANGQSNGMEPFWIYGGAAKIDRYVLMLPLSKEHERLGHLRRMLAAYRLVFGQPYQDDLLAWLGQTMGEKQLTDLSHVLRIDLSPDMAFAEKNV